MPLTPAHAAAAWPLHAWLARLPLDALVIGTLSPDFEYLFRLAPRATLSHSLEGIVLFCLPVSLAGWALYRWLVRPALVRLLPPGLAATVAEAPPLSLPGAALAIVLGALSHVAWDGITHRYGWVVMLVPALQTPAGLPGLPAVPWYRVLQYASSTIGLAALSVWIAGWVRAVLPEARAWDPGRRRRALSVAAVLAGAAALGALANGARGLGSGAARVAGQAAVGAMVGLAVALLAYGAGVALREGGPPGRRRRTPPGPRDRRAVSSGGGAPPA
jgi:hypothetical protein